MAFEEAGARGRLPPAIASEAFVFSRLCYLVKFADFSETSPELSLRVVPSFSFTTRDAFLSMSIAVAV
jgi:hypothetical protein